jgi:hypothetical protein
MAVKKRIIKVKVPTKRIKREIKGLRKGLKKEAASAKKAQKKVKLTAKKVAENSKELFLLKKELESLKKRKKRASLSDYNKFMRTEIRKGKSFKQAAAAWRKFKKDQAKKFKKRSSYNVFVSMELKRGKTMKQAIRAWNLFKNPPKKRKKKPVKKLVRSKLVVKKKPKRKLTKKKKAPKAKVRTRTKLVIKRIKSKPKIVTKLKRVTVEKPVVVSHNVFPKEKISEIIKEALEQVQSTQVKTETTETVSRVFSDAAPCNEELALDMIELYFSEIARFGLKRSLKLDEIIDSFYYALARIERSAIELNEIKEIVRKNAKI